MSIRLHFHASSTPPQERTTLLALARTTCLERLSLIFLHLRMGIMRPGVAMSFSLAGLDVGEDAALKGSTTLATIDLGPNNNLRMVLVERKPEEFCEIYHA
jgi:hypothetical protein